MEADKNSMSSDDMSEPFIARNMTGKPVPYNDYNQFSVVYATIITGAQLNK